MIHHFFALFFGLCPLAYSWLAKMSYLCIRKSCTRQFESKLSLRSFAVSLHKKKLHSAIWKQAFIALICSFFASSFRESNLAKHRDERAALHRRVAVPLRAVTIHLLEATIPKATMVNNHQPSGLKLNTKHLKPWSQWKKKIGKQSSTSSSPYSQR